MKPGAPGRGSKAQLLVEAANKRERALRAQGRYQEALDVCLQIMRAYPQVAGAWLSAVVNCVMLARWTVRPAPMAAFSPTAQARTRRRK